MRTLPALLLATLAAALSAAHADPRTAVGDVKLSPDGQTLGFIVRGAPGVPSQVMVFIDLAKGTKAAVSSPFAGRAQDIRWFRWLNNDRVIMACGPRPGDSDSIAAVNRDGTRWWAPLMLNNVFWVFGDSDRFLCLAKTTGTSGAPMIYEFSSMRTDLGLMFLPKLEKANPDFRLVTDDREEMDYWITDQRGRVLAGVAFQHSATRVVYREDEESPWKSRHGFDSPGIGPVPVSIDFDGRTAYVATLNKHWTCAVSTYDLVAQKQGPVIASDDAFDILDRTNPLVSRDRLLFSRKKQKLIGMRYPTNSVRTIWLDPEMARIQALIDHSFPDALNVISSWSDDENRLVIASYPEGHPTVYYFLDKPTRRLRRLFSSNR